MAILHEIDARLVQGSIGKVFARKATFNTKSLQPVRPPWM